MAYTNFTPETRVAEAQDATAFKIWDQSTWSGESALTTFCVVSVSFYAVDGTVTVYDDYELITGADKTKFNEYLDLDGHTVEVAVLTASGVAVGERFVDGYYTIRVYYDDGTYGAGNRPYYTNVQAFLAKARCKARKLPTKLEWPISTTQREINLDIFQLRMYLDAAEDAADLGKQDEYRNLIDLINNIYSTYAIDECF